MNFLIFIIVLGVLIIVHEFGHLLIAKLLGVRVEKFSLGFGPRLFSIKRKFTEYSVSLIPLGGYVKLAGDSREDFKGNEWEYLARPPGERAAIVFFGPVLNYFLAFLFFYIVFLIGYPTLSAKVGDLLEGYPAQKAGLLKGDQVITVDQIRVADWDEMQQVIRSRKEGAIAITVLRDKKAMNFVIDPRIEKLKNIFGQEEKVRLIGIAPKEEFIKLKYNFSDSFIMASKKLWLVTFTTIKAIWRMLTGGMSFRESVTGPLGIFYITSRAWELGIAYLLQVVALLSASLAIFNVLPLPVLDGGHLVLLGLEKIRKKPLATRVEDWIGRVGFSFIILLAVFIFYNDLVKFGVIEKIISISGKVRF
jgi:regulator of sigma E protease